ncbi:NAD-dependent epimerase/dehydratase family protein [Arundinibacter roseus]|uniref:SDR family NAD(P)-dependent oxidoreductase n=1 Tax=Arundinibacter roseus TaxID=2070510 RepID=A0A4R4KQZ5_9BACT|nr:NAD-dependent epimerase/dehydratase family protein [Arundinibacter roseus]TDB69069.1 SDR family NAD(P)-dependent oxidoreductase [Arundinibacter roseus]
MQNEFKKRISILGCGWLGKPLAVHLLASGFGTVKGSTTTPEKVQPLRELGIDAYCLSLNPGPEGEGWKEFLSTDVFVVDIPPRSSRQGGEFHPQQMQQLVELLNTNTQPKEILYISSTSVYPETSQILTEQDVTTQAQAASSFMFEAEEILRARHAQGQQVTILRCGGLMGYDRIPGKYVQGKTNLTTGSTPVNYVHQDDVVSLITQLIVEGLPADTFNVVAPQHPSRQEVFVQSCQAFGWTPPTFAEPIEPESFKIISGEKLTDYLHYTFRFPDPLHFLYQAPDKTT